jgi:hypothetical protein
VGSYPETDCPQITQINTDYKIAKPLKYLNPQVLPHGEDLGGVLPLTQKPETNLTAMIKNLYLTLSLALSAPAIVSF